MVAVLVCRKCKGHECIVAYLERHTGATVRTVRCQKVCDSPVAGLRVEGDWEWFGPVRGPKQLKALARLADGAPAVPKPLQKCRSRSRAGCSPR
ncbi:MAG: hypothetical protein ACRDJO_07075 [Actinomycetota bacterium]